MALMPSSGRVAVVSSVERVAAPMNTCGPTPRLSRRVTGSVQLVEVAMSLSEFTFTPARPRSKVAVSSTRVADEAEAHGDLVPLRRAVVVARRLRCRGRSRPRDRRR